VENTLYNNSATHTNEEDDQGGKHMDKKRSPNTRDDQIQQGTHGNHLQKPPKRLRENRTTRK